MLKNERTKAEKRMNVCKEIKNKNEEKKKKKNERGIKGYTVTTDLWYCVILNGF